jgi:hypothetical protein
MEMRSGHNIEITQWVSLEVVITPDGGIGGYNYPPEVKVSMSLWRWLEPPKVQIRANKVNARKKERKKVKVTKRQTQTDRVGVGRWHTMHYQAINQINRHQESIHSYTRSLTVAAAAVVIDSCRQLPVPLIPYNSSAVHRYMPVGNSSCSCSGISK